MRKKMRKKMRVRMPSWGKVTMNAPITAAIAPLAPRQGIIELGSAKTAPSWRLLRQLDRKRGNGRGHRVFNGRPECHRKTMLPMMCIQLACMNMELSRVME